MHIPSKKLIYLYSSLTDNLFVHDFRTSTDCSGSTDKCSDGPMAKKQAGDKEVLDKKKKDKKKTLKRL